MTALRDSSSATAFPNNQRLRWVIVRFFKQSRGGLMLNPKRDATSRVRDLPE
jgi:hypothetical protein